MGPVAAVQTRPLAALEAVEVLHVVEAVLLARLQAARDALLAVPAPLVEQRVVRVRSMGIVRRVVMVVRRRVVRVRSMGIVRLVVRVVRVNVVRARASRRTEMDRVPAARVEVIVDVVRS